MRTLCTPLNFREPNEINTYAAPMHTYAVDIAQINQSAYRSVTSTTTGCTKRCATNPPPSNSAPVVLAMHAAARRAESVVASVRRRLAALSQLGHRRRYSIRKSGLDLAAGPSTESA
jgi:hypothetical protein